MLQDIKLTFFIEYFFWVVLDKIHTAIKWLCVRACACVWIHSNFFYRLDALPDAQPTMSSTEGIEWCGAGLVIGLQRDADDLHMVHLMSLPPHHLLLTQVALEKSR